MEIVELPSELLLLWHSHRSELLVTAGILLALIRLTAHWRSTKSKAILTPPLGSPTTEKRDSTADSIQPATTTTTTQTISPTEDVPTRVAVKKAPRRVKGVKNLKSATKSCETPTISAIQPYIFYFTLGGSTKAHAESLVAAFPTSNPRILAPILLDLAEIDHDDYFIAPPPQKDAHSAAFYMIILPTYNIDTELANFLAHLDETHHDFRIDTAPLRGLAGYSVFGLGDGIEWPTEAEGYCAQAIEVDRWMAKLTGKKRAFPLGMGNVKDHVGLKSRLEEWRVGVLSVVEDLSEGRGLGEGVKGSGNAVESDDEESMEAEAEDEVVNTGLDMEDMRAPIPVDFTTTSKSTSTNKAISSPALASPKEMVPLNSPTHTSLTKQGYSIIGSHSGVKICRWTKSALRGRGSCYKYSFYGIASHRCMEATPSLSCSNKCIFCWRHGTNPVGTTWRWQVDPPEMIFAGMLEAHVKKIKMLRGVPGVRAERFAEGMQVRHCALSLVGEPIFYPHINQLLAMLHAQRISSFLVCNAQHPDQLASLGPVTQLYVSIDASNKESLRRIDRPLHRDFWERFQKCMSILREKRNTHRTVFRLTLVKGFNIEEEVAGYADLVEKALPGFVEVKGVTYCGTTTAAGAGLSMQNVPFYEEVQSFVLALEKELLSRGLDYGIGAEHAHSCCILLADRKRFEIGGKWHTLIDYDRFFELVEGGGEFGPQDYIGGETAEWAAWGKGGFDPRDERVDRKGRPKEARVDHYPDLEKREGRVVEI